MGKKTEIFYSEHDVLPYLVNNGFNHSKSLEALKESMKAKRTSEIHEGQKRAIINWTKNNRMIFVVTIEE